MKLAKNAPRIKLKSNLIRATQARSLRVWLLKRVQATREAAGIERRTERLLFFRSEAKKNRPTGSWLPYHR